MASKPANKPAKQTPVAPVDDPIVRLWNRCKKPLYFGLLAILGLVLAFKVVGFFQESAMESRTDDILAVNDSSDPGDAESKLSTLDDDEARATAEAMVIEKYVDKVGRKESLRPGDALSKASNLAADLAKNRGETMAGKQFAEGPLYYRQAESGMAPLAALASYGDGAAVDALLLPPEAAEDAPRITLKTSKGDLEFILYPDRSPELCKAFSAAAQAGQFSNLLIYAHIDAGKKKAFQFGDARLDKSLPEKAYPPEHQWGRGPNLAPIPFKPTGLHRWEGWIGAVVDQRDGNCSGREIAVFTEGVDLLTGWNYTGVVIFGRLSAESLAVAQKIVEDLEKLKESETAEDEGSETEKVERPSFLPAE